MESVGRIMEAVEVGAGVGMMVARVDMVVRMVAAVTRVVVVLAVKVARVAKVTKVVKVVKAETLGGEAKVEQESDRV